MITTNDPIALLAQEVVDHVNAGSLDDGPLWDKHWHPEFVSVEGDGSEYKGRQAVENKCKGWYEAMTVHGVKAHGPYVTPSGFCVRYEVDFEAKDGSMPRMVMDEIAVYTVENGKVVREAFFGRPMPACGCSGDC